MSLSKKKDPTAPAEEIKTDSASSDEFETVSAAEVDEVMKKYDRESNVRIWEGKPRIAVNVILAIFSLFCLYVTLFASWLEELRLTTFVAWIVFLGYLVFPARKTHQRVNHIPWYDILLMVAGTGAFLYYAFNAKAIIQQGSHFEDYQIVIGIIGITSEKIIKTLERKLTGWQEKREV